MQCTQNKIELLFQYKPQTHTHAHTHTHRTDRSTWTTEMVGNKIHW